MAAKYLNEFHVGDTFTTMRRTIADAEVMLFAGLTGAFNPVHVDQTFAEKGPFKTRIAHGMLVASMAVGLWNQMGFLEGTAIAALGSQWKYTGAVKFGDTIYCVIEVAEVKRSRSKPDRGILKVKVTTYNQNNIVCQEGSIDAMVRWEAPNAQ